MCELRWVTLNMHIYVFIPIHQIKNNDSKTFFSVLFSSLANANGID